MANVLIQDLKAQLWDVMNGDLWLDENFEKKLSGIEEARFFIRPIPELHSVAELLSHLAVWRRINIRRMQGESIDIPVEHPDNWRTNDELRPLGWEAHKKDFYGSQLEVIELLENKDDGYLDTISTYNGKSFRYLIQGLLHHDLYHLGQLGLTVKFLKNS